MVRWRILEGPNQNLATWVDGELWVARLENVNDPALQKIVNVVLSRTALQSQGVPDEVGRALATSGRTAIEKYLDEADPPTGILVASDAIVPTLEFPVSSETPSAPS